MFKPHRPTLQAPVGGALEKLEAFHAHATSGGGGSAKSAPASADGTSTSAPNSAVGSGPQLVAVFNDSAGAGFGVVAADAARGTAAGISSAPRTVPRIALRNMTDFPSVDALKSVRYDY
jgi:hypothetical protein